MVLQLSGMISLGQIRNELKSGTTSITMSSLYGSSAGVPVLGQLTFTNFLGKQNLSRTLTTSSYQLGIFGIGPWGASSGFADSSAYWIWNDANAAGSATWGVNINFQKEYFNNSNSSIPITVHIIIDNSGTVYLNNVSLGNDPGGGWVTTSYARLSGTILSGYNLFAFTGFNAGASANPAGLIYSVIRNSDSVVLMRSGSSTYI